MALGVLFQLTTKLVIQKRFVLFLILSDKEIGYYSILPKYASSVNKFRASHLECFYLHVFLAKEVLEWNF